jgi:hypothetical protein
MSFSGPQPPLLTVLFFVLFYRGVPRLAISGGLFCRLKRESRAEIDLQEVVLGSVNDIPGGFGEHPNMGSKAILEPSAKVRTLRQSHPAPGY